ncbi:hypothetical protein [Flavobacterium sp. FlaQc-30]|uniref:hypothetical protein n=1 Tax=Flavobacterium sp. FlaQc-30 TaxID=3374179 RepID=UPI00375771FA
MENIWQVRNNKVNNIEAIELKELVRIEAGFGPLCYATVGIWLLGVAYGYFTNI